VTYTDKTLSLFTQWCRKYNELTQYWTELVDQS